MTTTQQIGMTDEDEAFAAGRRAGVAAAAADLGYAKDRDWDRKWKLPADEVQRLERSIRRQAKEHRAALIASEATT